MWRISVIFIVVILSLGCNPDRSESQTPVIPKEKLRAHVTILASDDFRGRKTNEDGYLKAADYVADQLRETGLQPLFSNSFFQQVPFVEYAYGKNNWIQLSNTSEKVALNTGYIILNPGDLNGVIEINSLFFAGFGIHEPGLGWDDFSDADVRDKFVLMIDGLPEKGDYPEIFNRYEKSPESLTQRVKDLKKLGAGGLIVVSDMGEKYWEINTLIHKKLGYNPIEPVYMGDPYDPVFPVIMINPSLFRKHFPEIPLAVNPGKNDSRKAYAASIVLSVDVKSRLFSAPNVAGFIPGSDSIKASEHVILSAHLDHIGSDGDKIFHGANDNASSCAALLEVAATMVKESPARTVIFAFYTTEEPCLWGSNYFIRHIPFHSENILVNVNVEMVGKNDKDFKGFTAIGPMKFRSYFKISNPARVKYLDYREHRMKFRGSDQFSFFLHDVDAIRFGNLDYPEKHTERDDISIIDFDHLQDAANILSQVTKEIANSPQ